MTDVEHIVQLERENNKLKVINALQRQILAMRKEEDMQSVLIVLHDHLNHLIEFNGCSISLIDEESDVIRFYVLSAQDVQYRRESPLSDIPALAWRTQKTFYRKDLDQDDPGGRAHLIRARTGAHVRSVVDVPFSKGTIAINSVHPNAFSGEDIALLEELAQMISESFARVAELQALERQQIGHKRAEEALRESEAKYRNLVEQSLDGIYVLQNNNHFEFANERFLDMLGYTLEELKTINALDTIAPESRGFFRDRWQSRRRDEAVPEQYEFKVVRKDGSILDVETHVRPIVYEGRPASQGCIRDITERKRTEEQLLRQTAVLNAINRVFQETLTCETDEEVARRCLAVAEELTGSKFGFIGEVNPAGRFDTIALSDPGWDACRMPKSDAGVMIKDMEIRGFWGRALKEGRSLIINDPVSDPDRVGAPEGHPSIARFLGVPLKHAGRTIGMIALASKASDYDLTDQQDVEALSVAFVEALHRKRAEETLRESEKKYKALADLLPQTVFEMDEKGYFTFANHHGFKSTGYTQEDFDEGLHALQLVIPEDRDRVKENIQRILSGGKLGGNEYKALRRDGSTFPVIIYSSPIIYRGRSVGVRGIVIDITERVQMEQQLVQAERLRALGEMAAGMAHSFNNILVGVMGYADLIPDEVDHPETVVAYAREIVESAHRAASLIRSIQGFTRMRPGEGHDWVNLNEIVEESILLARPKWQDEPAQHGHRVTIETVYGEIPRIKGNEGELSDVVINLIFNAVEAMPSGGTITIRTEQQDEKVCLVVSDAGIGMDEATKKRIFEPLYTTKGYEIGRGLGLSSVYSAVQRHGGHIEVKSAVYQGTTFTIGLPILQEGREERGEEQKVVSIPSGLPAAAQVGRILLVEDDEPVRNIVGRMLKHVGHTVEITSSGSEALERFQTGTYDLVITDLGMPGMSGDTLADRIRALRPTTPVVALTGWQLNEEQRSHFDEVLKKPANREALHRVLAKCFGESASP